MHLAVKETLFPKRFSMRIRISLYLIYMVKSMQCFILNIFFFFFYCICPIVCHFLPIFGLLTVSTHCLLTLKLLGKNRLRGWEAFRDFYGCTDRHPLTEFCLGPPEVQDHCEHPSILTPSLSSLLGRRCLAATTKPQNSTQTQGALGGIQESYDSDRENPGGSPRI